MEPLLGSNNIAVEVLLATYNGEKYIAQQFDSLVNQTYKDFHILVRDDGSSDRTLEIIQDYINKYPSKISLIDSNISSGSASKNFGFLLNFSQAKYVMCCDQDDIWLPEKIEYFVRMIDFYEKVYGPDRAILFHADLKVVSESLEPLSDSLWKYQNIKVSWGQNFNRLLSQNLVTGCSCIVNRALLNIALPIPQQAVMHDWWLALVANAKGVIVSDQNALMLYRQHSSNVVGAKRYNSEPPLQLLKKLIERTSIKENTMLVSKQAEEFYNSFPETKEGKLAHEFASLPYKSAIVKRFSVITKGFWKMGFLRNVSWLIRM